MGRWRVILPGASLIMGILLALWWVGARKPLVPKPAPARVATREELRREILPALPAKRAQPVKQRILVIGFDGFSSRMVDPLLAQGALPNFQRLIDGGTRLDIDSTPFPSSATAWPSLVTGCPPEETGMHSFFLLNPRTYDLELIHAGFRKRLAFWEIASKLNRRVAILNVPMTYPPDRVDGVMIGGLLGPRKDLYTFPAVLSAALDTVGFVTTHLRLRQKRSILDDPFAQEDRATELDDMATITMNQYAVSGYILGNVDWDIGMAVFTLPDRLQHNQHSLPREAIEQTYRNMDVILGGLMRMADERTRVLIVSDHGFRPYRNVFSLVPFLIREGFLTLSDGKPDWAASQLVPMDRVASCATLRWNIEDREALGVVTPSEIPALTTKLEAALQALPGDSGGAVFRDLRELGGATSGPELLIRMREDYLVVQEFDPSAEVFREFPADFYDHEAEGFGVAYAPGVFKAGGRMRASVLDVAANTLYLAGLPVPEEMTGKVLADALTPGSLAEHPVSGTPFMLDRTPKDASPLYSPEELEEMKSLGYVNR